MFFERQSHACQTRPVPIWARRWCVALVRFTPLLETDLQRFYHARLSLILRLSATYVRGLCFLCTYIGPPSHLFLFSAPYFPLRLSLARTRLPTYGQGKKRKRTALANLTNQTMAWKDTAVEKAIILNLMIKKMAKNKDNIPTQLVEPVNNISMISSDIEVFVIIRLC